MRRPNILLLYTDQQRWDALGANGNTDIQTPHLDQLAHEGINFDHYFVQNPVCMPSRLSFLTGQYPSTLGITHMGVPVPEDAVTLPHLLRNYGYHSANIGKLHFRPHANRDHREPHPDYGFDHLEISDEPGPYADAYRAWVAAQAPAELDNISLGLPPTTEIWQRAMGIEDGIKHPDERFPIKALPCASRSDLTHTAFVADQTIDYIDRHQADPFLCIAGFYSPHSPWVAPQEYIDRYDADALTLPTFPPEVEAHRGRRDTDPHSDAALRQAHLGYYAMVSEVDHHVGRILAQLDELGLADNTIVVFTSDHGEWLGEHLKYGKGYPGHDCITRVPLLVRWPGGQAAPGRTESGLVEGVDVVPTLLECAGIQVPYHLQGQSLYPALLAREWSGKAGALTEMHGWKTLRNAQYRYLITADGREQLYDLTADPDAYRNLSDDPAHGAIVAQLRRQLLTHQLAGERPLPRTWTY